MSYTQQDTLSDEYEAAAYLSRLPTDFITAERAA